MDTENLKIAIQGIKVRFTIKWRRNLFSEKRFDECVSV
jgi:hypothetical protein